MRRTMKSLPVELSAFNLWSIYEHALTVIDSDSAVKVGEEDHLRLGLHVWKRRRTHCDECRGV